MTTKQKDIVEKMKAAMVPVLLPMLGFFLAGMYYNYNTLNGTQQQLLIEFREYKASSSEQIKFLQEEIADLKNSKR